MYFRLLLIFLVLCVSSTLKAEDVGESSLIVAAEGLSDGNFYKDRRVAYDEALKDAKRQVLDKAVGAFVNSKTRIENYQTISDTLETHYQGFIKQLLKTVDGGLEEDGFYHVWIKAEVSTEALGASMARFSRSERTSKIRECGNPSFAVDIKIISADGNDRLPKHCDVCETEIAARLSQFGYRLVDWRRLQEDMEQQRQLVRLEQGEMEAARYAVGRKPVDILVTGQVKLKNNPKVTVYGIEVSPIALTSWSVRAIAAQTNEVIFSQNFRPHRQSYQDEDQAIVAVGRMAGELFSEKVFESHVCSFTRMLSLSVFGLDDRRLAQDLKRDLLAARSVIGVRFKDFHRGTEAVFEIDYVGTREEFAGYLSAELLSALNRKYGKDTFAITRESGDLIQVNVLKPNNVTRETIHKGPNLAMSTALPERAAQVIKSQKTLDRVTAYNPDLPEQLDDL